MSGLSLPTNDVLRAIRLVKLHTVVQLFNFGAIPAITWLVSLLLRATGMNDALIDGLLVLSCVPTTITACVVLARASNANEAAALFNATFGNIVGIFLSPALMYVLLATSSELAFGKIILDLCLTVLLPFVIGQIVRAIFAKQLSGRKIPPFQSIFLLIIIWGVFSTTFSTDLGVGAGDIILTFVVVAVIHFVYLAMVWFPTGLPGPLFFKPPERATVLFCSTQKTLSLGVPLIQIVYEGNTDLALLTLPLLLYHPFQIFVAGLLVGPIKSGINKFYEENKNEVPMTPRDGASPADFVEGANKSAMAESVEEPQEEGTVVPPAATGEEAPPSPKTAPSPTGDGPNEGASANDEVDPDVITPNLVG